MRGYATHRDAKLRRLESDYATIAGDAVEFRRARRYIKELTKDREVNAQRLALRSARLRLLQGHPPQTDLEESVAWLLDTRRERWRRLAHILNVPFPDAFHLYRGVKGKESVGDVVTHWMGPTSKPLFPVLQHSTASWSLQERAARVFMGDDPDAVMYVAQVDFDLTFADMLVDDSSFVVPYQNQWEVVAGPVTESGALYASKMDTVVRFQGVEYTFEQRDLLWRHWSTPGPSGTLSGGGPL